MNGEETAGGQKEKGNPLYLGKPIYRAQGITGSSPVFPFIVMLFVMFLLLMVMNIVLAGEFLGLAATITVAAISVLFIAWFFYRFLFAPSLILFHDRIEYRDITTPPLSRSPVIFLSELEDISIRPEYREGKTAEVSLVLKWAGEEKSFSLERPLDFLGALTKTDAWNQLERLLWRHWNLFCWPLLDGADFRDPPPPKDRSQGLQNIFDAQEFYFDTPERQAARDRYRDAGKEDRPEAFRELEELMTKQFDAVFPVPVTDEGRNRKLAHGGKPLFYGTSFIEDQDMGDKLPFLLFGVIILVLIMVTLTGFLLRVGSIEDPPLETVLPFLVAVLFLLPTLRVIFHSSFLLYGDRFTRMRNDLHPFSGSLALPLENIERMEIRPRYSEETGKTWLGLKLDDDSWDELRLPRPREFISALQKGVLRKRSHPMLRENWRSFVEELRDNPELRKRFLEDPFGLLLFDGEEAIQEMLVYFFETVEEKESFQTYLGAGEDEKEEAMARLEEIMTASWRSRVAKLLDQEQE